MLSSLKDRSSTLKSVAVTAAVDTTQKLGNRGNNAILDRIDRIFDEEEEEEDDDEEEEALGLVLDRLEEEDYEEKAWQGTQALPGYPTAFRSCIFKQLKDGSRSEPRPKSDVGAPDVDGV